ncbi:hypothetical protein JCM5296_000907 [Sporobolomyces johnsonii]
MAAPHTSTHLSFVAPHAIVPDADNEGPLLPLPPFSASSSNPACHPLPLQASSSSPVDSLPISGPSSTSRNRRPVKPPVSAKAESTVKRATKAPATTKDRPPRPANAWICYRSAQVVNLKNSAQYSNMPQADLSKLIGQLWRTESPEVRKHYELQALDKKLEHELKYPGYVFHPVHKNKRKKKDKATKKPSPAFISPPAVLQPPYPDPVYELPTPPYVASSAASPRPSTSSSTLSEPDVYSHGVPPLSLTPEADGFLPLPPPAEALSACRTFHQPIATYQSVPSPPWEYYKPFPPAGVVDGFVAPSQLASLSAFSPGAGHDYRLPAPAAISRLSNEDWTTTATATTTPGMDFGELPYPYST